MSVSLRLQSLVLAAAAALFSVAPVSVAYADTVTLEEQPLEVQIWPGAERGHNFVIVTGFIPEEVSLPATVRLPLPPGLEVVWAGEILGGPVDADPPRDFVVADAAGGSALEMTAETTHTVQYEAIGQPLRVIDGMTTAVLDWVQTVPAGDVLFAVRIPASGFEVRIDPEAPGEPLVNEMGEKLYTLRPVILTEGQEYQVTAAYGPPGAGRRSSGGLGTLQVLLALLAVAVVVLVVVLVMQRRTEA